MNERKNKSLYTLTKKFVEMLKSEEIVDLNIVTSSLNCAKKRRIYDVSNVLEGVGLIKKTQKNLYQYTGKTYKDENSDHNSKLETLKNEKKSLDDQEKELDKDLHNMRMNNEALLTDNSYKYLTKKDFLDAFGKDNTNIIIKDYRTIKVVYNASDNMRYLHILGYVVRPCSVQLVNSQNVENSLPKIDLEQSGIPSSVIEEENDKLDSKIFNFNQKSKKSDELLIFRRNRKKVPFLENDQKVNEELSKNVLQKDKYKGKSKFLYVSDNNLVLDSDYMQPDFVKIVEPLDSEYIENYSCEPPSIHDLFDHKIESNVDVKCVEQMEVETCDEMIEEEYIIEELDEESLELLQ